jgi:hypothetical protein
MTDSTTFQASIPGPPLSDVPDDELRDALRSRLQRYAAIPIFHDAEAEEVLILANPYRRPLRSNDLRFQDFTKPLKQAELSSNHSLSANRTLFNIYESDLVFLPPDDKETTWTAFSQFYGDEAKVLGELVRPSLENHVFGFLEEEITISGRWSAAAAKDYLLNYRKECRHSENKAVAAILSSPQRKKAAQTLLIQFACDFLSEASAMARNVLGNYGPPLSELFKVLSDEYGYGVHRAKHSTLFEETMKSCGLDSGLHAYWQFYLPTSLLLSNYFHYVSRNHGRFFRYLGALYCTETSLIRATKAQSEMLKAVFGEAAATTYFDEHTHIDKHHSRMALENLILPVIDHFGDRATREIIRGFEELRLLQDIADEDFIAQVEWMGNLDRYREAGKRIYGRIEAGELDCPLETFFEAEGERSTTHVHDDNRLLVIETGEMDFWPGHPDALRFGQGDVLFVPEQRLHGSVVRSAECFYHQPLVQRSMLEQ